MPSAFPVFTRLCLSGILLYLVLLKNYILKALVLYSFVYISIKDRGVTEKTERATEITNRALLSNNANTVVN